MEITTFLAQLWGPVIFAVGLGVFISRSYYVRIYRDLEREAFAALLFGMIAITAGVAHILAHNVWESFTEGLISFLGWALFIKGALFLIAPRFVDRAGNYWASKKLVSLAGTLTLIAGAYLIWFAYLA